MCIRVLSLLYTSKSHKFLKTYVICLNPARLRVRTSCFLFSTSSAERAVCKNCYLLAHSDFFKALLLKINFVTVLILLEARLYRKFFVGVKDSNKDKKETWWKIGATC